MFKLEQERRRDTEYMATILWSIGRILGSEDYPLPNYHDFINPKMEDRRDGQTIVNSLIEKLREGGATDGKSA